MGPILRVNFRCHFEDDSHRQSTPQFCVLLASTAYQVLVLKFSSLPDTLQSPVLALHTCKKHNNLNSNLYHNNQNYFNFPLTLSSNYKPSVAKIQFHPVNSKTWGRQKNPKVFPRQLDPFRISLPTNNAPNLSYQLPIFTTLAIY